MWILIWRGLLLSPKTADLPTVLSIYLNAWTHWHTALKLIRDVTINYSVMALTRTINASELFNNIRKIFCKGLFNVLRKLAYACCIYKLKCKLCVPCVYIRYICDHKCDVCMVVIYISYICTYVCHQCIICLPYVFALMLTFIQQVKKLKQWPFISPLSHQAHWPHWSHWAECLNPSRCNRRSSIASHPLAFFFRFWQMRHYFWFNLHLAADNAELHAGRGRGGETAVARGNSIGYGRVAAREASLLLAGSRAHELTTLCIGCHFEERQILHMSLAAVRGGRDREMGRLTHWLAWAAASWQCGPNPLHTAPLSVPDCQLWLIHVSRWQTARLGWAGAVCSWSQLPVCSRSRSRSSIRIWIWS